MEEKSIFLRETRHVLPALVIESLRTRRKPKSDEVDVCDFGWRPVGGSRAIRALVGARHFHSPTSRVVIIDPLLTLRTEICTARTSL